MVMDQGSIVEMETPKVLLTRPTSKFYTLCEAGGKAEFEHLKKLAGLDVKDSEGTLIWLKSVRIVLPFVSNLINILKSTLGGDALRFAFF